MAGATVECAGLTRIYRRGTPSLAQRLRRIEPDLPEVVAVDDVDLTLGPAEFVGIAGPSGSGKSTLLHLIAGLDRPTDGRVVVDGTDVGDLSGRQRTRFRLESVGVVFQHFHLLGSLSARANVALPLVERGVPKATRRERATELLERVGLGDRIDHRPTELSGGEQQRVAIARALATDPPLVVADEPTGELDSETTQQVLDVLADVGDRRTVVMASHDRQSLERTDRVVRMQDGRPIDRDAQASAGRDGSASAGRDGSASAGRDGSASAGRVDGTDHSTESGAPERQETDPDGEPPGAADPDDTDTVGTATDVAPADWPPDVPPEQRDVDRRSNGNERPTRRSPEDAE